MVGACFESLNSYGKKESSMETIIGVFEMVLIGYEANQIKEAFREHIRSSRDFPTPSEIVRLIDPPKEWCVEKYRAIKEDIKNDKFVTQKDKNYVKEFLNRNLKGW